MTRSRAILVEGVGATEAMWPDIRTAFAWVHRAAAVLRNREGLDAAGVRRHDRGLVGAIGRHRRAAGRRAEAFAHFFEVRRSYWPGRFGCYEAGGLPRNNNELEQFFDSYRHHERRCTGPKVACPGTVVRGSVRLASAAATRPRPIEAADLVPADVVSWRALRGRLERRRAVRTLGRRFRRDPAADLKSLEGSLINQAPPS